MDVEIIVVGGGIAGVALGYELARERSVLLVEAEPELARHTTGRSAALFLPSYGPPAVRLLTGASRARYAELVTELDTPPLLTPRTVLHLGADDTGAAAAAELRAEHGLAELPVAVAVGLCPPLAAEALRTVLVEEALDIDVMALHQGYVRGLRARGGRVRTGAGVRGLRRDGSGWLVELPAETVRAGLVVDAAGAWADRLAVLAGVRPVGLRPLRRTIAIAAVPAGRPDPAWPMVADAAERFYFRPEGDGLLISPEDETPSEPVDARPDELDVALALDRVNAVTTFGLRSVRTAWAGLRSFVADREPVIGSRPDEPGFAFHAAQGGYGIQSAPAAARYAAALLLDQPLPVPLDPAVVSPSRCQGLFP
jgi:D-arginine dehydrogenase